MREENKIEEMAKVICLSYGKGECRLCYDYEDCQVTSEAERLYEAGYRKASEVAAEIFAEIDDLTIQHAQGDLNDKYFYFAIDELRKKYESEDTE